MRTGAAGRMAMPPVPTMRINCLRRRSNSVLFIVSSFARDWAGFLASSFFFRVPDIGQFLVGQLGSDPDVLNNLSIRRFVGFIIAFLANSSARDLQHIADYVRQGFRPEFVLEHLFVLRR